MPTIINPVLPNILTNGTTADATQVMADFASIISQVNANAAENGANNSITSLSGLTTALSVAQGGTGDNTLTQYAVLLGAGTAGIQGAGPGAGGYILISNGLAANPTFQPLTNILTSAVITGQLGFNPVQQGTGTGQGSNVVKIGWSTATGNGVRITIDTTDQGYPIMSPSNNANAGYVVPSSINATNGLLDNGNRVWSPGNYNPLTQNGIGFDTLYGTAGAEGATTTISGRPGTWMYLSAAQTGSPLYMVRRVS